MGRGLKAWPATLDGLKRVVLDTNAVIYLLDGTAPYAPLVSEVLRRGEAGALSVVIPTLVELELLVGPLRGNDDDAIGTIRLLLDHFPNLELAPLDRAVARAAADVRARHGLSTPDAIVVGTAIANGCDAVIGNDQRWARRFTTPRYILLSDHVARGGVDLP